MSRILFDPTMQKWLYGDLTRSKNGTLSGTSGSSVFYDYYDDPTYMTFKIEFGDWGASVLDRNVLNLGVTTFQAQQATYDQLPVGLLNCPSGSGNKDASFWQNQASMNAEIFNNTVTYSAFTYLRSRNEDIRAEYLFYFVNGLFDIQRQYPYIFKRITGMSNLDKVQPEKGVRLDANAEITLECYEGLDLKIKTLLELYRKAAWDDEYQKWILPENMRQFKMIIYIFERRIFQKGGTDGRIVPDEEVNLNVPVKVYECCPCEFVLDSYWNDDYDQTYESSEVSTSFRIKVKNVKTFYKNGLLKPDLHSYYFNTGNSNQIDNKLSTLLVYDLIDKIDRTTPVTADKNGSIENSTLNGVRSIFMNKKVYLGNTDYSNNISHILTWDKKKVKTPKDVINKIKALYGIEGGASSSASKMVMDSTGQTSVTFSHYVYEDGPYSNSSYQRDGVSKATSYYNNIPNYGLGNGFPHTDLFLYGLLQPRDHTKENMYSLPQYFNGFSTDGTTAGMYTGHDGNQSTNTSGVHAPTYENDWWPADDNQVARTFGDSSLWSDHVDQQFEVLHDPRTVTNHFDRTGTMLNNPRHLPNDDFAEMNEPREVIQEKMSKPNKPRQIGEQEMNLINDPRELSPEQMMKPNDNVRRFKDQFQSLNNPRVKTDEDMLQPNNPRDYINDKLNTPNKPRTALQEDMNILDPDPYTVNDKLNVLNPPTSIIDDQLIKINDPREITLQQFEELNDPRSPLSEDMLLLNPKERDKDNALLSFVNNIRLLPGMEEFTMNDARELPEDKLQTYITDLNNTVPAYQINQEELKRLVNDEIYEKPSEVLVSLDKINKEIEETNLNNLKNNDALMSLQNIKTTDEDAIRKQEILQSIKDIVNNTEEYRNTMASTIIGKKQDLKSLTNQTIDELPKADLIKLAPSTNIEEDIQNQDKNVLISLNDTKQIEKNIKLVSLQDAKIRDLSLQTLVELNNLIDTEIQNTSSMIGLTKEIEERKQEKLLKLEDLNKEQREIENKKRKTRLGDSANRPQSPKKKKNSKIIY